MPRSCTLAGAAPDGRAVGLLENLRGVARGMREMADQANAASRAAEEGQPLHILNPTPQPEVDRLLAAGGVARGVVVRASHSPLEPGERVEKMRVTVRVRSRGPAGQLGPEATVKIWTSWKVVALLDRGLEIPATVDRATGTVTDIPNDVLVEELRPRFGESAARWPGWGTDIL